MQIPEYNRQHYEAAGVAEVDWDALAESDKEYPACAWCHSPPKSLVRIMDSIFGGPFHLVECRWCGLRFVWPRPHESRMAAYAVASAPCQPASENTQWADGYYLTVLAIAERLYVPHHLAIRPLILDVGCGSGHFLRIAARRGFDVYGCDWSPTKVRDARRNLLNGSRIFCQSFHPTPPTIDSGIHFLSMFDYLEHSYRPFADLQEAHELIGAAGGLILKTFLDDRDRKHEMLAPPVHLYHFTEDVLLRMIEDAGFTKPIVMHDGPGGVMVTVIAARL